MPTVMAEGTTFRTLNGMSAGVQEKGRGLRRLRWKLRGAQLWPAFALVTVLEMLLLHWLPLAGEHTGLLGALLLAGCLNIMAVALLGGLGGVALRRRRPDLPKVVADNYAGTAALGAVAVVFVAVGLAHRPEVADERAQFAAQTRAVQRWVQANGDAFTREHLGGATTLRVDANLYRTCLPGVDPRRWLCLIVETSQAPPRVTRDPNNESNASWNPRGSFR
ncbi:MAG: hypothetical protein QOD69_27 [Solirubrobacteraceae bacterium]|jgi:hypothetical protein|nr:hypothetical protein [Solirubrobacteraceae bacterium]